MPPTPTPSAEQIEAVREIALLYSFAQAEELTNKLNNASWMATIADLAAWAPLKNDHTRIEGDGVKIDNDRNRLDITNRLRLRLGLNPVESARVAGGGSYCSYTPPLLLGGRGCFEP